jgi:hypothetical protein
MLFVCIIESVENDRKSHTVSYRHLISHLLVLVLEFLEIVGNLPHILGLGTWRDFKVPRRLESEKTVTQKTNN